jgi:hypothetical protein
MRRRAGHGQAPPTAIHHRHPLTRSAVASSATPQPSRRLRRPATASRSPLHLHTDDDCRSALRSTRNHPRSNAPRVRSLAPTTARRQRRGGGRHRQVVGGSGGLLHPRAGHRPRGVPVWPRRVPRPLVRRRRHHPGAGGRSIPGGLPAYVRGPQPHHRRPTGPPHGRNAVPAFDVVLRPTKSVSILYGLGDAATGRAVLSAHHAGLAEAVHYLDEHLGARRGHGGVQHVSGQGLLAVGFDHRTSREGDPLPHTHLVIANRVQGPDGHWTALDGRDLYRHRLAADAIYRATYQRELSRTLGVGVDGRGRPRQPRAPRAARGTHPRVLQAHQPDRRRAGTFSRGGSGADAAAGQVDCARDQKAEGARSPGHPVWPMAGRGGRARTRPGRAGPHGHRPGTQPGPG